MWRMCEWDVLGLIISQPRAIQTVCIMARSMKILQKVGLRKSSEVIDWFSTQYGQEESVTNFGSF
jgi:hypothetical protein